MVFVHIVFIKSVIGVQSVVKRNAEPTETESKVEKKSNKIANIKQTAIKNRKKKGGKVQNRNTNQKTKNDKQNKRKKSVKKKPTGRNKVKRKNKGDKKLRNKNGTTKKKKNKRRKKTRKSKYKRRTKKNKGKRNNKVGKKKGNIKRKTKGASSVRQSLCYEFTCLTALVSVLKVEKDLVRNFMAQEKRVNTKANLMGENLKNFKCIIFSFQRASRQRTTPIGKLQCFWRRGLARLQITLQMVLCAGGSTTLQKEEM